MTLLSQLTRLSHRYVAAIRTNYVASIRTLPFTTIVIAVLTVPLITACDNAASTQPAAEVDKTITDLANKTTIADDVNQKMAVFIGCYTVSKSEPAQIKVSRQGAGYVMQMRERNTAEAGIVWDTPEPLEPIATTQTAQYFSIDDDKLTAIIGRPDRMLVIGHVVPTYVNINPLLDSEYLGFIYQGANTIFKVDCV